MTRLYEATVAPHRAAVLGPTVTQAVATFRSPQMPHGVQFALLPALEPTTKPWAFPSIDALARHIHRNRQGEALQLVRTKVRFRDCIRPVTEILAEDQVSGRTRRIGFAWIAGRDWTSLQAALERAEPTASFQA